MMAIIRMTNRDKQILLKHTVCERFVFESRVRLTSNIGNDVERLQSAWYCNNSYHALCFTLQIIAALLSFM